MIMMESFLVDIILEGPIVLGCWLDHACSNRHCPSIMTTITALTDHTSISLQHTNTHTIINIQSGPIYIWWASSSELALLLSFMTSSEHSNWSHWDLCPYDTDTSTAKWKHMKSLSKCSLLHFSPSFLSCIFISANNGGRCLMGPARCYCSW